jgi:protein gp37
VPEKLAEPLRWSSPKTIFVNSMSDLFHAEVPDEYITAAARVMQAANWHTYQVLTKRSERMRDLLRGTLGFAAELPHIWWGVSVENRKHGLPRIEHLRSAPARVRFLSVEPLLEDLGTIDLTGLHWVIAGGESGPGARPMREEWVRSLREQCLAAQVPFFFKQWGGVRKARNGRVLDGRTYDEIPARVSLPVLSRPSRLERIAEVSSWFPTTPPGTSTTCDATPTATPRCDPKVSSSEQIPTTTLPDDSGLVFGRPAGCNISGDDHHISG